MRPSDRVAGFMSVEILRSDRNPHPIPLFEIHGTEDRTTRWEGDLGNEGGWGAYVSVPTAVGYWAAKNKCLAERIDTLPSRPGGLQVIAHRYTEGTDGNEVWLYETVGGKHSWKETGVDTGEELWKFFSRYVRVNGKRVPNHRNPFSLCRAASVRERQPVLPRRRRDWLRRSTSPARIRFERSLTT